MYHLNSQCSESRQDVTPTVQLTFVLFPPATETGAVPFALVYRNPLPWKVYPLSISIPLSFPWYSIPYTLDSMHIIRHIHHPLLEIVHIPVMIPILKRKMSKKVIITAPSHHRDTDCCSMKKRSQQRQPAS